MPSAEPAGKVQIRKFTIDPEFLKDIEGHLARYSDVIDRGRNDEKGNYRGDEFCRSVAYLCHLTWEGARQRYGEYLTKAKVDNGEDRDAALQEAANGTLANEFGQICENAGEYAHAAEWYKKAKAAGCACANESLERMNALYGMARYYAPWLKIATATGRRELALAIQNIVKADPKLSTAMVEEINIAESAVPPCYEEIEYWEQEFDRFAKFSDSDSETFANLNVAIGKILERARIYNMALRWYKKAVANHPTANQDAHRMLPLKSKSEPLRDAEDIYDAHSPIPSLWKS